jgi:predicted ribosomally synthesized peptide with nif11-like leader
MGGIMSLEDAKRLVARMDTDEVFRERILTAKEADARLRLAGAEGYDVTEEEMTSAAAELSDADLDAVGGGSAGLDEEVPDMGHHHK